MPAGTKLQGKAGTVHERLQVLNRLTNESVQLLDVLGASLQQLSAVTAPIHSRATALTAAQHNIAASKGAVDKLLEHLDTSRRVQPALEAGPVRDLDGFLDALTQLEASNDFLVQHGQLAAVQAAVAHSQAVFNKALESCDSDFRASLSAAGAVGPGGPNSSSRGGAAAATAGGGVPGAPDGAWLAGARQALGEGTDPCALVCDLLPPSLLPKLRRMVELMMQAEYAPAQESYISSRSRAIHQVLAGARLELPSSRPGLLPPEQLDRFMGSWGQQLTSLTLLLLSEQRLAEDVWPAPLSRQLFGRLAQPFLASLVAAGHDIVEARKSPDKIFLLLDMHIQISLSLPLLLRMLAPPSQQPTTSSRRSSAAGGSPHASSAAAAGGTALIDSLWDLQQLVASAALRLFGEYEEVVARDASKTLPADGTIHPLTAQVLSYVKRLLSHPGVADILHGRHSRPTARALSPADEDDEGEYDYYNDPHVLAVNEGRSRPLPRAQAGLAAGVTRLLVVLLDNLELKSRGYKNEALAALFIMNNVHYVQQSVETHTANSTNVTTSSSYSSPRGQGQGQAAGAGGVGGGGVNNSSAPLLLLELLGVPWLERHKDVVEEWGAAYHDATWMPLVHMLRAEPPQDPVRLKQALKDTYSAFNAAIESIYTSQSGWTIPDHSLRAAVKRVIKDDLLDTYQAFLRRHADVPFSSAPAKYIKYAAADVASIIDDDLFETKAVSMNKLSLTKEKLGAIV